jgi:uncharacterized protein with PQ loop repeat
MAPHPGTPGAHASVEETILRRALGAMSVFTLVMTGPQIWTIWASQQPAGVSILSWSAYLLSALLWFWYGLRKGDKTSIYPVSAGSPRTARS